MLDILESNIEIEVVDMQARSSKDLKIKDIV